MGDTFSIYKLTDKESGIIIYNNDDINAMRQVLVCNWSAVDSIGLPVLVGGLVLLWLDYRKPEGECRERHYDDIRCLFSDGYEVVYDPCGEVGSIIDGMPIRAKVWEYGDVTIVAPNDWE